MFGKTKSGRSVNLLFCSFSQLRDVLRLGATTTKKNRKNMDDLAKCLFYTRIYRHHIVLTSIKNALEFRSNKKCQYSVYGIRMCMRAHPIKRNSAMLWSLVYNATMSFRWGIVKHFGIQIYLTIYYTFHFWTERIFSGFLLLFFFLYHSHHNNCTMLSTSVLERLR